MLDFSTIVKENQQRKPGTIIRAASVLVSVEPPYSALSSTVPTPKKRNYERRPTYIILYSFSCRKFTPLSITVVLDIPNNYTYPR
jgi:hypothetical protein